MLTNIVTQTVQAEKISLLTCHPAGRKGKVNDSKLLVLLENNEPWWVGSYINAFKCLIRATRTVTL